MIEIEHLTKRYGNTTVVDDVSLSIAKGTITVVVGTSGSGKSTLLRMINRLVEPSSGRVLIDGRDTMSIPEDALRHRIGYAIQGHGLFPHRTVAENIATVPRLLGWDQARIDSRVDELLRLFQLAPDEFARKYPQQLSGGQQQRVGVARALAAEPELLLMDEPFGALDPIIRGKAQEDLLAIQRRFGTTVILVTHDMEEAFHLGDKVAVMDRARLLQYGTPAEILVHPAEAYVERLVGTADRPFRLLSLSTVADALEPGPASGQPVDKGTSLRDALARMMWAGRTEMPVVDGAGAALGKVSVAGILAHGRQPA
ncbi:ABC transporter ATP-binding protein [Microvirga pudoricolor]|uniref:ABC transporter ATP-binding protein n=1 Tax=Microvirga pudoricolor TaxID=2778729 RepID=UPI0019525F78|nr:ABC transporter ATP-binding protein [Microvirga pudoricolor]MBM6592830.1 ABC transporter ATP-binding protein [Microvirga pudoricolor]